MTTTTQRQPTMLLRLDEAAEELRVSVSTVRRLIANGDLPRAHVGTARKTRITRKALNEYVEQNTVRG